MSRNNIVKDVVFVLNGLLKVGRSGAVIHRNNVGTILRKRNLGKGLRNGLPANLENTFQRAAMIPVGITQWASVAPKYIFPEIRIDRRTIGNERRKENNLDIHAHDLERNYIQSLPKYPPEKLSSDLFTNPLPLSKKKIVPLKRSISIDNYYHEQLMVAKFSTTTTKSSMGGTSSADSTPSGPTSNKSSTSRFGSTENPWTIPNALCVMRIGMAPVAAYMILNNQFGPALGVFAVAGVTDLLDGWIARVVPGQATVMGSFLDPLADKILVGTLFLSLTYMDLIPVALTGLIIGRDAILIMFGFYIRYQSLDPPRTLSRYFNVTYPTAQLAPTVLSKINTGVQLGLICATMVSAVLPYDVHTYLEFLWYFTATTTVASAVGYLFAKDTVKLLRKRGVKSK